MIKGIFPGHGSLWSALYAALGDTRCVLDPSGESPRREIDRRVWIGLHSIARYGEEAAVSTCAMPQCYKMKKFLEMIAVILLVFGVIGAGVFLFQKHGNGLQGAPTNLEQEASSTMMIVGGP